MSLDPQQLSSRIDWATALPEITGLPAEVFSGKHGPCPKCGGKDRYRFQLDGTGGAFCNQCFNKKNGDGFAFLMWWFGETFPQALQRAADYIGGGVASNMSTPAKPKPSKAAKKTPRAYQSIAEALSSLDYGMSKQGGKRAGVWIYHDAGGCEVGAVVRCNMPTPDGEKPRKEFRPLRCDGGQWSIGGMPEPRQLYRLPEVMAAEVVFIVEGEKTADALARIGITATTSSHGSKSASKTDWTPLSGRNAVIVPDADDAGEHYAVIVIGELAKLDPPPVSVRILRPFGDDVEQGYDFADWDEQHDGQEPEDIKAMVLEMIESAEPVELVEAEHTEPDEIHEQKEPFRLSFVDSKTFFETEYRTDFLIDNVLVEGQPVMFAGPKKSMKTSLIVEAAVSIASGAEFLGKFNIRKPSRVCVMSGESGMATLQETGFRVCESKGVSPTELNVLWSDQTPQFGSIAQLAALENAIEREGCEVLVIDPLYFCIPDVDAANLMAVGAQLRPVAEICSEANVTLFLCHHSKKNVGMGYEPLDLSDIAGAGMGEFARQWWLINRRESYELGSGEHRIWFGVGGSAGHSGLWGIDIEEGVLSTDSKRYWQIEVKAANEARTALKERKAEAKATANQLMIRDAEKKLLNTFTGQSELSRTAMFTRAGVGRNANYGAEALGNLLRSGELEPCEVTAGNNSRKMEGFRRKYLGDKMTGQVDP